MRITFVLASGFGLSGGERAIAAWARELQARGHQVLLISPPPRAQTLREQLRAWRKGKWKHSRPASHFDHLDVPRMLLETYRPVRDTDVPDAEVVIATWWETAEWVAALAPAKGVKVYLVQGHEVFDFVPRARAAATYRLSLHKIVVAPWLAEIMRNEYGDDDVSLVTPGIDHQLFDAPPRGKKNMPTIGLMYSPLYIKGCDVSLAAFALAKQRLPNLKLVAFGSEEPLSRLPLPSGARFVKQPPQTRLRELYAQCDAWLVGSRTEGFSLPPMEAMACRTPVIGTAVGGVAELIATGGILVPQEDSDGMARGILRIADMSEEEWRTLSDRAYAAVAPYTWERSTDQLEAALHRAVKRAVTREEIVA